MLNYVSLQPRGSAATNTAAGGRATERNNPQNRVITPPAACAESARRRNHAVHPLPPPSPLSRLRGFGEEATGRSWLYCELWTESSDPFFPLLLFILDVLIDYMMFCVRFLSISYLAASSMAFPSSYPSTPSAPIPVDPSAF